MTDTPRVTVAIEASRGRVAELGSLGGIRPPCDCGLYRTEEREAVKQKRKEMKVPKAKQSTLKPVGFIAELRAALKPVPKKSKRNKSNPYQVNSGRLSCRDFGLI